MKKDKVKVLLAEDDDNLGKILKHYLDVKGFPTTLCVNGQEAINTFHHEKFDFCILDIMMPLKDGFTLAKEIKKSNSKIPVLFLTAKSMQEDIIKGFDAGADDYITKPFNMEELLARMNAILRRTNSDDVDKEAVSSYSLGRFGFDINRQILVLDGAEQRLTSKESALLIILCDNLNEVVDRSLALNKIWKDDSYFNARSMDVYITKLRKYLKADPTVELINVHGIGFKLIVN